MNPEEGDLRPQLLDRFALAVDVAGMPDPAERAEVVRRRIAYEADPAAFARHWQAAEDALRARIKAARAALPSVQVDDRLLDLIARICTEFEVDGLRADIVIYKAAPHWPRTKAERQLPPTTCAAPPSWPWPIAGGASRSISPDSIASGWSSLSRPRTIHPRLRATMVSQHRSSIRGRRPTADHATTGPRPTRADPSLRTMSQAQAPARDGPLGRHVRSAAHQLPSPAPGRLGQLLAARRTSAAEVARRFA